MYGYIYKITNTVNGKIYVGKHKAAQFEPDAYQGSGILLHHAYEKYGKDKFRQELLCTCDSKEELDASEIFYISQLNSQDGKIGYNLAPGGLGGGAPHTDVTRDRIHVNTLGRIFINDGCRMKRVYKEDLDSYLSQGFVVGVLPFKRSNQFKERLSASTTGKRGMHRLLSDGSIETCWAYPPEFQRLEADGWCFGWKPKLPKGEEEPRERRKHMYKNGIYKQVPLSRVDQFLSDGWIFQCATKGHIPWNKGKQMSTEIRKTLSAAHTGEKHSPERIDKHAKMLRGRVVMHKDGRNKLIPLGEESYYQEQGWIPGRIKKNS